MGFASENSNGIEGSCFDHMREVEDAEYNEEENRLRREKATGEG